MSHVEPRYAEALLASMPDVENADKTSDFMSMFSKMLTDQADVKVFFTNPVIPKAIKKETIKKILDSYYNEYLSNFMCLLVDKGRLEQFPVISEQYKILKDKRHKKLEIIVYSSFPVEKTQLDWIRDKYMKKYGSSSAVIIEKIDPKYLGGIQIQIGDIRINDTISARLEDLRTLLAN